MKNQKKSSGTSFVAVLDVGTSGIKAFVFDSQLDIKSKAYKKIQKFRPKKGWVEQDPQEILRVSSFVLRKAVKDSGVDPKKICGIGITNQREATVIWNKKTGRPIYPVIGWEDDRTRVFCSKLKKSHGDFIRGRTGLTADPYFSASKIRWILQHTKKVEDLAFGTIDSWLIWNLCEGNPHVTDETNAARTLLFNIQKREWSDDLLGLFEVPKKILPRVLPSRAKFGKLKKDVLGFKCFVLGVCGDQQASAYAAIRSRPTSQKIVTKVTYGTGVFVVQTLKQFVIHPNFFTTLVPTRNESCFAFEGKIEKSGETVTNLLSQPKKLHAYFQTLAKDVDKLIRKLPVKPTEIVIDGGITRDCTIAEIQSKISKIPIVKLSIYDGTALGTALLVFDQLLTKTQK